MLPPPRHSRARTLAILGCVALVLLVYVRSAWSYEKNLDPAPRRTDFHNLVADALVHRQTELTIKPPRGLVRLKNPYDPVENAPYRAQGLHDLTLYKGKLYAFYGPAPAVLLFIPFRLLRVGELSPTMAGLLFCTLGFAFSVLLFRKLTRRLFGPLPTWMDCFAILGLGLAIPAPFIIYIGRAYEVSIACGFFLTFAGLYFLVSGLLSNSRARLALLALGSTALAGAVGARPNLAVGALFVIVAVAVVVRCSRSEPGRERMQQVAAIAVPYVAIGALLVLYNLARFGAVAEFGAKYQLTGADSTRYAYYQLWYIPHGLYYYLIAPARFSHIYPYAFLLKDVPFVQSNDVYTHEPVAGVLTNMPLIGIGLVSTATQVPRLARESRLTLLAIVAAVLVAFVTLTSAAFTLRAATMRYALDFAPLLLVAVLLAWVHWTMRLTTRGLRFWLLQTPWIVALSASVIFNLAITLTPCQGAGNC